ncbi:MAG: NUDIX hydrolase [Candidatus Paceibacterota bacterium]|jgi:8-oxo-dGTP pyrophosphatase MutT (NUDIX family)
MKLIKTISDKDFFPNNETVPIENTTISRTAVRTILFNKNNEIALVGETYIVLPGGGMEKDESYEETIKREVKEEIGYEIDIIGEIGKIIEYRNKAGVIQESYCLISRVKNTEPINMTQINGLENKIIWFNIDKAIEILDKEYSEIDKDDYHSYFNIEANRIFLLEAKKSI